MEIKNYRPRVLDTLIEQRLNTSGALLIEGPKWCGKTWAARHIANSEVDLQDPDKRAGYLNMADTMPSFLLQGAKPRLIDEWQEAPQLWDAIRYDVDKTGEWGQYLLTGSVTPQDQNRPRHSGTGRISRVLMRPMSLYESGESNGTVSISELFRNPTAIAAEGKLDIPAIANAICRGGWPEAVVKATTSELVARNYLSAVTNQDIQRLDGVDRDPVRVKLFLRSYARNISTLASLATIQKDVQSNDTTFSEVTLYSYLQALRRMYLIEDVQAWKPSLRSKSAIRTSDKRQFVDPSIAVAAVGGDKDYILNDFEYFGFLFESLVTRDLRIYTQTIDGEIFHYRDKDNLEADLIIRLHNGQWAPVEVKLGSKEIEDGAKHLLTLEQKVDTTVVGKPTFKMVVTGGQFAYQRPDGVYVVPLSCLRP